ncbi:MAG TPA: HEXXH motif-containing putative peptide modification protein [Bacteriovoracaceae bacterium]|nr:HEXXH motif-containing putative peptide modification protein [Bacteriovoracaceae bacterium]
MYVDLQAAKWLNKNKNSLRNYSSTNWFLLTQLDSLFYFKEANFHASRGAEFSGIDDEILESWNKNEFADVFLGQLNQGSSVQRASHVALKSFDQHLVTLAERVCFGKTKLSTCYRLQSSLGEVSGPKGTVTLMLQDQIDLFEKSLVIRSHSIREGKRFRSRIETALKVIRGCSPSSWERFVAFTEMIVPIKQREFVSYSHQELPGVSMINLFDRDFVDLLDDLLHENGHHHLNYYLSLTKLIEEPIDAIYYSPWRRTPRPLRGIYHAYFTFFWAFKLFADLLSSNAPSSQEHVFSEREIEKIRWRAVEEYHMLSFSYVDLTWALGQGLISKTGWKLIEEQQTELEKFRSKILSWEKKLTYHVRDLKELKSTLREWKKRYLK